MGDTPPRGDARDTGEEVRWVSPKAEASELVRRYAGTADARAALERACRWSQLRTADRRRKAAVILSALTGPGVCECASRLLDDEAAATRLAAIAALGNVDDPKAVAQLELLQDGDMRHAADRALCRSPSAAALAPLRRMEQNGSLDALIALAGRGAEGALDRLRQLTRTADASYGDRARALRALGGIDPAAIRPPDDLSTLVEIGVWYEDNPDEDPLGIREPNSWRAWLARCGEQRGESWTDEFDVETVLGFSPFERDLANPDALD